MKKVFCIGELLIDFVAEGSGANLEQAGVFAKKAGGAPANVAAAVARLGGKSSFIGCVGHDAFGSYLQGVMTAEGVDVSHLQRVEELTTLAFVSLAADGERDFVFNRGADRELKYDPQLVSVFGGQVIHFGAATAFLGGPLETGYVQYLKEALASGCLVSFDPNFRSDLWKEGSDYFVKQSRYFLKYAHFAKLSLEEALLITGEENERKACEQLHRIGVRAVAITLGKNGTYLSVNNRVALIPSVEVKAVDTTGAGDAFVGCVLRQLAASGDPMAEVVHFDHMKEIVAVANRAGALTTTGFGAIPSLPYLEDINALQPR